MCSGKHEYFITCLWLITTFSNISLENIAKRAEQGMESNMMGGNDPGNEMGYNRKENRCLEVFLV